MRLGNIRLQALVLALGAVLMGIKFAAWRITGSNAVLSDALESIVNVVAGGFALYALILAARPRDREHPYGHGKVEFISAGLEGGLITVAGVVIIARAIQALIAGYAVHELGRGILLTSIAGGINMAMGLALKYRGRRAHSLTLTASGTHLMSDAWSTLAMLLGLVIIRFTGQQWVDGVFALGFGLLIGYQGIGLVRRAVSGIMDETDMSVAADVVRLLQEHRRPQWVDMHNFRMISFGSTLHIDCHVTLPWYLTLEQAHAEIAAIERLVNEKADRRVEFFIHMDPCVPPSCAICSMAACAHRKAPHARTITWEMENVLSNEKHHG